MIPVEELDFLPSTDGLWYRLIAWKDMLKEFALQGLHWYALGKS